MQEFVLANGFHEGKLKNKAKPKPPRDLIASRYARLVTREAKWQVKFEQAERLLAKATKERRTYERRHGNRLT